MRRRPDRRNSPRAAPTDKPRLPVVDLRRTCRGFPLRGPARSSRDAVLPARSICEVLALRRRAKAAREFDFAGQCGVHRLDCQHHQRRENQAAPSSRHWRPIHHNRNMLPARTTVSETVLALIPLNDRVQSQLRRDMATHSANHVPPQLSGFTRIPVVGMCQHCATEAFFAERRGSYTALPRALGCAP